MRNPNGKDCVRCHRDHNGESFPLIHWEPSAKQFDHRQTGYPLEAKHRGVACEKCHTPAHMAPEVKPLIKQKDLSKSFFGLSPECLTCHADPHKGQLGKDCQSCHNVSDWKDAKLFDHSKTRYPLTGMHAQVACEKCHKPDHPGGPARFRDMQFATCTACHADPHHGAFNKKVCEECHTTAGWKKVLPTFAFDHSKTKFPLLGLHAKVNCSACHLGGDFKRTLAFALCTDCHKDIHSGQFKDRPKKGECSECHTVDGWKRSLFGVKEHATSRYPLEGKHIHVECAKCHIPAGQNTLYKVKYGACSDCHKDAHDGQFAKAPYKNRCENCHTVQDFHRSLFTIAKHGNTKFPLTGAHAAVACVECHKVGAAQRTDKIIPFLFSDRTCTGCHPDPHHGEFRERMERRRSDGTPFGCEACHNSSSWTEISGFDHSKTGFLLLGAHRIVACSGCHKPEPLAKKVQFKGVPHNCEACHADPHGAQFLAHDGRDGKTQCANCHGEQRWVPSTFDHDKRTRFPLQGGHANVACDKCHSQVKTIEGKSVLYYKPTPVECEACHGSERVRPRPSSL